ncbi:aminoacyl-histidine dipeptidase [Candidatus Epulonipiscium fishelsonii]|nr:aminoacyl-histidine dipeptidase [Epulopiscium sp. SCG-C06WGA-EpuloA1]
MEELFMTVLDYFKEICNIPRGSGNEKAISDYMVKFAEGLGLAVKQDKANNVYIFKPATKGYENCPTVILQGHLDMVCEKDQNTKFDFQTQGLDLIVEGDWIKAKGTTLGADNGIAIAYQMAILADNSLKHGPIECLMTTEEETGMGGVANLHPEYLKGKILLNMDTDIEGEFLVSCAGGIRASITVPFEYKPIENSAVYEIHIKGLTGGHSGAEIHHERANANVLAGYMLAVFDRKYDVNLISINGGNKDNVITRECTFEIAIPLHLSSTFEMNFKSVADACKGMYKTQDPNMEINYKKIEKDKMISTTETFINLIRLLPNGIQRMNHEMKGLVETSSNVGVVKTTENNIEISISMRSSTYYGKIELASRIQRLANVLGVFCKLSSDYPGWEYQSNSRIREMAVKLYKEMYHKEPEIKAIHAGLECGFLAQKLPNTDIIAFGPTVKDIHSPNERASISSMNRVYEYVVKLLEEIKNY